MQQRCYRVPLLCIITMVFWQSWSMRSVEAGIDSLRHHKNALSSLFNCTFDEIVLAWRY